MKFEYRMAEVLILSIFFTALALYFNIHGRNHVLIFIIDHVIALLIALIISKIIYSLLELYNNY